MRNDLLRSDSACRARPVARLAIGMLAFVCASRGAGAQDLTCEPGDVEVMRLAFEGNRAFSSATLSDGIVTTQSSWARRNLHVFGKRRCLDRQQFPLDVVRLLIWYRNHGYTDATVDTVLVPMGTGRIGVRFSVHEGEPVLVDSLAIVGLESVPERDAIRRGLATRVGRAFDKYANEATREAITQRLRDGGYPDAEVFVGFDTHTQTRRASVTFTVVPGVRVRFGEVAVRVTPREGTVPALADATVRRVAGVVRGDLYSERELERAKRALYQTEAFSHVNVVADSVRSPGDTTVGVTLAVTEGLHADRPPRRRLGHPRLCARQRRRDPVRLSRRRDPPRPARAGVQDWGWRAADGPGVGVSPGPQ